MTEIRFYHLLYKKLPQALPEILAKALEREYRVIVKAETADQLKLLSRALWTHNPASFLPHGMKKDGHESEHPIWLTKEDKNPNAANMLVLTDGVSSDNIENFDLCCELFDGNDEEAVVAARARWKDYKEKEFDLSYFQQDKAGKWQKKQ